MSFRTTIYQAWQHLLGSWLHLVVPEIKIYGNPKLVKPGNVLILSNHLSWADIIAICYATHQSWPMVKFMLKSSLKYEIPLCVFYSWLNHFPIIKHRALSKAKQTNNKEMRKTLKYEIVKALNVTFKEKSSLLLFCEGTRGTPEKRIIMNTPYQYLLPAKAGGVSMSLRSMINSQQPINILDVTLIYRGAQPSMLNILLGNIHRVEIHIEQLTTPKWLEEDLLKHPPRRTRLNQWLKDLWLSKDKKISAILSKR